MTVYLISRLSINGHKYVTVFLDLQILDDFVVKYLPLPKRYDTNFNVPLSIHHLSLRNSKNIFGHCRIFASDATWKLHPNQAYLNITIILFRQKQPIKKIYRHLKTRSTKNCTRGESNVQWLWDWRRNWKLRFLEIRVTKISKAKSQCLWFGVVILRFARKISYWLSNRLNHFSVFHSTVYYQEVVLFVMPWGNFRVTCRVLVD